MTEQEVTPDEVIDALERVLRSNSFAAAPRSRNFLAYVVTETLAGREHRLSERTVGRRALDRPDDFDGRLDASVRVRATRVRKALDAYYATSTDPVRILLPAGRYTPVFRRSESPPPPKLETAVVVTTATGDSHTGLAEALSQETVRQLQAFPGLRVVGPVPPDDPDAVATRLGIRFVLHPAILDENGAEAVELAVFDATSHATVWTTRERLPAQGPATFDVAQWAHGIAGQIGDYTGVIFRRSAEFPRPGDEEWAAMQAYYSLFATGDRQAVTVAVDKLTGLVSQDHNSPMIVAALAHCLSLRAGYALGDDEDADCRAATSLAHEALAADPGSATAHLALATVALVAEQRQAAIDHATTATVLAPYHPSILGTAGVLMALAGNWDGGVAAIRQALHLNPGLPGFSRTLLALDHLFTGDDALALAEAALITSPTEIWGPYFRALALMGLGYRQRALDEMDAALVIDPAVLDGMEGVVQSWVQLTPEQLQVLTARLLMFQ